MKSDLPKVLHPIGDKPMICLLLDRLVAMSFDNIVVVVGYRGEMVEEALSAYPVEIAWQREQLGTAHAVEMAREHLVDFEGTTLVAAGDVPYLSRSAIEKLFEVHSRTNAAATCLSALFEDPSGYGRIIRDGNSDLLKEIIEHKDASEETRQINEINSGTFCFDNRRLFEIISEIDNQNAQQEYYLTDAVKILHDKGLKVSVVAASDPDEVRGVNSVEQLAFLEGKFGGRSE